MFKNIFIALLVCTLVSSIFNSPIQTQAVSSVVSSQNITALPIPESTNPTPTIKRQITPKIINGELDLESNTIIAGEEKQNFENCKKAEKEYRSVRNKNKPTACFKKPQMINDEFTDQVYTTLFDRIQDKKDADDKKDMDTELKLKDFVDITNTNICNEKSFKDKDKVFSKIGLNSKVVIPDCESQSSTNSISSISDSKVSSNSLVINSAINQSSQISLQISSNSSTASKTSFLDLIFGTVKASAAGTIVYDYRFPYPNGTNVSTYSTFNEPSGQATHIGHNAIDFWALSNVNNDIVASRAGTVVVSSGDTNSIGNHIVVLQDDGNYALYGHLSSRVAVNTVVKRGDYIGKQGKTGAAGTAEHLHFEVLQPSILNYTGGYITTNSSTNWSTCQYGWNAGFCFSVFTLDQYKVYPVYDECWVVRGGTQNNENNCKVSATGGNTGYPWRSQAYPLYWTSINTPPVQIYNSNPGTIDLVGVSDTWSLDVLNYGTANGTRVNMVKRTTAPNLAQKWQYFPSTKEIKGINDLCLDSGNSNDGDFLRINSCTGNPNQKWNFNANKTISDSQSGRCIQYEGLYSSGSAWQAIMRNCTGSNKQTFVGTGMNIPAAFPTVVLNTHGYYYCMASANPNINSPVYLKWCNFSDIEQQWEVIPSNTGGNSYRRKGTTKCIDRPQASNGLDTIMAECNLNSSSQAWTYNVNNKLMYQVQNSGQCWAVLSYSDGVPLRTYNCYAPASLYWMNPIAI
jgi:murein DD-endopeptidase MepM/ murein hydrolase activator NlpD